MAIHLDETERPLSLGYIFRKYRSSREYGAAIPDSLDFNPHLQHCTDHVINSRSLQCMEFFWPQYLLFWPCFTLAKVCKQGLLCNSCCCWSSSACFPLADYLNNVLLALLEPQALSRSQWARNVGLLIPGQQPVDRRTEEETAANWAKATWKGIPIWNFLQKL